MMQIANQRQRSHTHCHFPTSIPALFLPPINTLTAVPTSAQKFTTPLLSIATKKHQATQLLQFKGIYNQTTFRHFGKKIAKSANLNI